MNLLLKKISCALTFIVGGLLAGHGYAQSPPPILASYLTDADEEIYVALYNDTAVELSGCTTKESATTLLQLNPETAAREDTLNNLTNNHRLGQHPVIPCGDETAIDGDFSLNTPVWADPLGSKLYYLEFGIGSGRFYTLPADCDGMKEAFGIRQRIATPGILQNDIAPPMSQ